LQTLSNLLDIRGDLAVIAHIWSVLGESKYAKQNIRGQDTIRIGKRRKCVKRL